MTSPDLRAAAEQVAAEITAHGVPAVVDSRELELPGAWVTVGTVSLDYLDPAVWAVTWNVYLIARDLGSPAALQDLGEMLQKVAAPLKVTDVTPQSVVLLNHSADPLPAFSLALETNIN